MVISFYETFIKRLPSLIQNVDEIKYLTKEKTEENKQGQIIIKSGHFIRIKATGGLEIMYDSINKEIVVNSHNKSVLYNHRERLFYYQDNLTTKNETYPQEAIDKDKKILENLEAKIIIEQSRIDKPTRAELSKKFSEMLLQKKEKERIEYLAKDPKKILEEILIEYS